MVDESFVAFVYQRRPKLVAAATLICGDVHLAEDLTQEALVKVAQRWHHLRDENPMGYARRILYRDAVSAYRRRSREVTVSVTPDSPMVSGKDVAESQDLLQLLNNLPPRQRAVIVLRYYDDLTIEQTAEVLGVTHGTVKRHTHVGLQNLRRLHPEYQRIENL